MRIKVLINDFKASILTWKRSKGTLFWTIAFPIILILIFGAIFSGQSVEYDIYIRDLDNSPESHQLISIMNDTGILKPHTIDITTNLTTYMKNEDITRLLEIPKGYGHALEAALTGSTSPITLTYYYDPSEQSSSSIVRSIISDMLQRLNLQYTQGRTLVELKDESTITEEFGFIDFFIPGMIGFTIMQSCIYGSIERNTKFRKDGILRKLLTTPITRSEWIFSKMLFMLFLSFISTILIGVVGWLVWGVSIHVTPLMIIIIIATSFLFSGMGMLIGRFVKEEETADTAGGAISFPMMFLAGTFFPLDQMPVALQTFARVLPLYYVNEGLRNAMIYMKFNDALINTFAVLIFAAVFFIAGVVLTKWHED